MAVRTTILVGVQDTDGFYLSTTTGLTSAIEADVTAFGVNRPARCDRLLHYDAAGAPTDAACTASLTRSRQGAYTFDRNPGTAQALVLGYATGNLRFESEFLFANRGARLRPLRQAPTCR